MVGWIPPNRMVTATATGVPIIDPDHDDGFCDTGTDIPTVDPYDPFDPNGEAGGLGKGAFTGGACSVLPIGVSWLPSLFLAGVALMRRRRLTAGVALGLSTQCRGRRRAERTAVFTLCRRRAVCNGRGHLCGSKWTGGVGL